MEAATGEDGLLAAVSLYTRGTRATPSVRGTYIPWARLMRSREHTRARVVAVAAVAAAVGSNLARKGAHDLLRPGSTERGGRVRNVSTSVHKVRRA